MSSVPVTRPTHRPRTRVKRRARISSETTSRAMTFMTIAAFAYLASSMVGQVMVEKARREGIHAMQRAVDARKTEAGLSKRLDELTSLQSISDWAKSHDFYSQEELVAPAAGAAPLAAGVPGPAEDMPPVTVPSIGTRDKGQGTRDDEPRTSDLEGTGDKGQGTSPDATAVPSAEGRATTSADSGQEGSDADGARVAVPAYSGSSWATTGPAPAPQGERDKGQGTGDSLGTRDKGQATSETAAPLSSRRAKHARSREQEARNEQIGIFSPDRLPQGQDGSAKAATNASTGAQDPSTAGQDNPDGGQILGQALNPADAAATDSSAGLHRRSRRHRHHRTRSDISVSGEASTPGGAEAANRVAGPGATPGNGVGTGALVPGDAGSTLAPLVGTSANNSDLSDRHERRHKRHKRRTRDQERDQKR